MIKIRDLSAFLCWGPFVFFQIIAGKEFLMKTKKHFISMFVLAFMMFAVMSLFAPRAEAASYNIWVAGTQITDDNKSNVLNDEGKATVVYNSTNNTLTLDGATIQGNGDVGIYSFYIDGVDLTIVLKGQNKLIPSWTHNFLFKEVNSNVTIKGTGSLDILPEDNPGASNTNYTYTGITIDSGTITLEGGTMNIKGIRSGLRMDGGKFIVNGGTLNTARYRVREGDENRGGIELNSGEFVLNGGTVNAYSTEERYALRNSDSFTINGGTFNAYGCMYGIDNFGSMNINGGVLNTRSGDYGIQMEKGSTFTQTGGTVNFKGDTCGLYTYGLVTVDGGRMDISGDSGIILNNKEDTASEVCVNYGTVSVKGDTYGIEGYNGNILTIEGGNLFVEGGQHGLYAIAGMKVRINGGIIQAKGGTSAVYIYRNGTKGEITLAEDCQILKPENGKIVGYCELQDEDGNEPKEFMAGDSTIDLKHGKMSLSSSSLVYNTKVRKPSVKVVVEGYVLEEGTDYDVKITSSSGAAVASPKAVGKYTVRVEGKGAFKGSLTGSYSIVKASNMLSVKGKTATVKYKKLKKKAQALKVTAVIKFANRGQGTLSYAKVSGNKKIVINKKSGKVTLKKGLKKGTYKVTVKVKAAGNSNYKSLTRKVTFKIKVK